MLTLTKPQLKKIGYAALAGFGAGLLVLILFYFAQPKGSGLFLITFYSAQYHLVRTLTLFLLGSTLLWGSLFYWAVLRSGRSWIRMATVVIVYMAFLFAYYYQNIPNYLFEAGLTTNSSILVQLGYATGAKTKYSFFRNFIRAVEGGDPDVVNLLIQYKHRSYQPPAYIEYRKIETGQQGKVEWIAFKDNRSSPERELLKSIFRQDENRMKALLAQGVKPNARDMFFTSAVMITVSRNDYALSRQLIELGGAAYLVRTAHLMSPTFAASALAQSNSYSALRLALANHNVQLVQLLLQAQVRLTSKDLEIALGLAPGTATENVRAKIIQTQQDPQRQAKLLLALFSGQPLDDIQIAASDTPAPAEVEQPAAPDAQASALQEVELSRIPAIFRRGNHFNLMRIHATGHVYKLEHSDQSKHRRIRYYYFPSHDMRSVAVLGLSRARISLVKIDENGDPIHDTVAEVYRTDTQEYDALALWDWSRDNKAIYFTKIEWEREGDTFFSRPHRLNLRDNTVDKLNLSGIFVAPYSDDSVLTSDSIKGDPADSKLFSTLYREHIFKSNKEIFLKLPGKYYLNSRSLSRDRNWLVALRKSQRKSTPTYLQVDLRHGKAQETPFPKRIVPHRNRLSISPTGKHVAYLANDYNIKDHPYGLYIDNQAVYEPIPETYALEWITEDSLVLYPPLIKDSPIVFTRQNGFWEIVNVKQ